jgi:hypothetical protein
VKGQGNSWNVIVIATTGVVVLIVLIILLINNSNNYEDSASSCENKGGVCVGQCGENYIFVPLDCPKELPKCCIPRGEEVETVVSDARKLG